MLPARKKRKVVVKRQYPLLRSHGGVVAAQSSEGTDWSRLPHLVLVHVFLHLSSPEDRRSVALVCRDWNNAVNSPCLWKLSRIHLPAVSKCRRWIDWNLLHSRRITRLSLDGLSPLSLPGVLKSVARNLPELRELELNLWRTGKKRPVYDLQRLADITKLEDLSLHLNKGSITIPSLPTLRRLVIIEKLGMIDRAAPCVVEFSESLPALEVLDMTGYNTLKLDNFPCLKTLKLATTELDYARFISLQEDPTYPSIQRLDISHSSLCYRTQTFFSHFPNLFSLNLTICSVSDEDLIVILGLLVGLKELNLTCVSNQYCSMGNFATDAVLSAIRSALASLTVQDCPMLTVQGLKSLSRHCHQTLVSLDISRCTSIKHCSVSELHVWFPKLTTLECSLPPFPSDAQ